MRYETIYFDLDGTLTDSGPGITNSVAYALTRMGRPVPSRPSLNRYIGPPLWDSFRRYEAMTEAETQQAVALFREYYEQRGKFENAVYSGIPALLQGLREGGKRLVVATSKPEVFALRIMEHFGLARYFDHICGAPMDNQEGAKKAAVIRDALRRAGVEDLSTAVMVGDRRHDIDGARQAGLEAVGVLWGYGDLQELEASHPVHIVESFDGLKRVLI